MKICIDPGHSGPAEPGACAAGITEAQVNLAIARILGERLSKMGHAILYTREGNIDDDGLAWRARMANNWGADVYISIHCNAAESGAAHGVETYHFPGSAAGRRLAECIQRSLACTGYTRDRGVKAADFAVLRLTDMTAVLVECGFLTNAADRAFITSHSGQVLIAAAIAEAIADYAFSA